jgi:hypothetical protein
MAWGPNSSTVEPKHPEHPSLWNVVGCIFSSSVLLGPHAVFDSYFFRPGTP